MSHEGTRGVAGETAAGAAQAIVQGLASEPAAQAAERQVTIAGPGQGADVVAVQPQGEGLTEAAAEAETRTADVEEVVTEAPVEVAKPRKARTPAQPAKRKPAKKKGTARGKVPAKIAKGAGRQAGKPKSAKLRAAAAPKQKVRARRATPARKVTGKKPQAGKPATRAMRKGCRTRR
jgi:hypothetical protein